MKKNLIGQYSNKVVKSFFTKKILLDAIVFTIMVLIYLTYINAQPEVECEGMFGCLDQAGPAIVTLFIQIIIVVITFSVITPIIVAKKSNRKIFNNMNIDKSTLKSIKTYSVLKLILTYVITYVSMYIFFFLILGKLLELRLDNSLIVTMLGIFVMMEFYAAVGTTICFMAIKLKK